MNDDRPDPRQGPFACDLSALDDAQRRRREILAGRVAAAVRSVVELPNGWALRLDTDPEVYADASELLPLERKCCPFLQLDLRRDEDRGPILEITGRGDVKAFVAAEFGLRGHP